MARLKPRPTNLLRVDERNTRFTVLTAARQPLRREVGSKLPHSKMASASTIGAKAKDPSAGNGKAKAPS